MKELIPVLVAGITPFVVLVLIVAGVSLNLIVWQPPIAWTDRFGTPGSGSENGVTSMSVGGDAFYAAGFVGQAFSGQFRPSPSYVFLNKYAYDGGEIWSQQIGNPQYDHVAQIATGSNGIFLLMFRNNTGFVEKYGLNGTETWSIQGAAASISSAGAGVYASTPGSSLQNGTTIPAHLRHYDDRGNVVWTKTLGNESRYPGIITYASSDALYFAGADGLGLFDSHAIFSKYDLNGTLIWTNKFDVPPSFACYCAPTGISSDSSGLYVTGLTRNAFPGQSSTGFDGFIRKYSLTGNELWTVQFGAPDFSAVDSPEISLNPSGVYLEETTTAGHGFIHKFDQNGNDVWSLQVSELPSTISAGQNSIFVGGDFSPNGEVEAFVQSIEESSSLVLFGLNPPFSFAVVAGLVSFATLGILFSWRINRKRLRPPSATLKNMPKTDLSDHCLGAYPIRNHSSSDATVSLRRW